MTNPRSWRRLSAPLLLGASLLAAAPAGVAFANADRARAAQERGDLRAAQIEWRNAVRGNPNDPAARAGLAQASLDLGDGDTAEREARAALERGFDRVQGTSLLLRAQFALGRFREVLREFPEPAPGTDAMLAGQILAGRSVAHLALDQRAEARAAAEAAVASAPRLAEAQFALSTALAAAGDRAGAEAATDRALAIDPLMPQAVLRKAAFLFERGQLDPSRELLGRLIAAQPGLVMARVQRAEVFLRQNNDAAAREDVEAALRSVANNLPATYLRAMLQARAQDWRAADETLQRLGGALPNLPDGLLLLATVKRQLNQTAQALDAAQRHVARRPEDPRGAKMLAQMEMEGGRFGQAAATLQNLLGRGVNDAEAFDLLGRAQVQAGRPREAAEAFRRAAELAPRDAALLARLAAARMAVGDTAGMGEAARAALEADPNVPGARLLLAMGAVGRGDLAGAEAELGRLDAQARASEGARVIEGTIRLIRFEIPGARAAFETALRDSPQSVPARLGLARVASLEGNAEQAERLLGEVLQRDPANGEAIGRLAATASAGGPRAAPARALLEQAHAASPNEPVLAFALAGVLARANEPARAVALLEGGAVRSAPQLRLPALLQTADLRAAQGQWAESEAAARAALAEDPNSSPARRAVALLVARRGDTALAEQLLEDGLRNAPGDALLLTTLVSLAQQRGGADAALAAAERVARRPGALPAAATLRGDVLLANNRPAEAAAAYRDAYREAPSSPLALRQQAAWLAVGRPEEAAAALRDWVGRPEGARDTAALNALASLDTQAGRAAEAERRLRQVVEINPQDALALNNLAWMLQERGEAGRREALPLAERAFFNAPTAEIADTLGWTLARSGQAPRAVPLLRQAAAGAAAGRSPAAPGIAYRLAYALNLTGDRAEALRVLEPVLAGAPSFPERAEAERLMATLRSGGR